MALAPGTRLGPYEITAPLGAGGMGEVYRARDTKLGRDVAVKVLPPHLSQDEEALGRFEREAQAVAALSHPNILAIFDFGSDAGVPYAVTELLDGETLRVRLTSAAGPLPVRKAVEYGVQIVRGIAAAHEKGIVHRDLKPENVFITRDGQVKVLDFGLAKAVGSDAGPDGARTHEAETIAATDPGTVLGTVGYMSPEQVRGRALDHRTDIFSFGAMFYEMLTGRRAFQGDSHVETMNAILKEDPPEFAEVSPGLPVHLDRIVRRCLEKNPDERFHSAHDLGISLEALSGSSGQSTAAVRALPAPSRFPRRAIAAAAAVVLAAAAFFAGRGTAVPEAPAAPTYQRLTYRRGPIWSARFAPGGESVVYSAVWEGESLGIYSTRAGSPESSALPFPNSDVAAVSSSGELAIIMNRRAIRGYARPGTLARAPLAGGAARVVLESVQDADWLPDGSGFVAARFVDGRFQLEFPAGTSVYETGGYISHPRVSPNGELVAFLDHTLLGDDRGFLAVTDKAGSVRRLTGEYSSAQGVAWASDDEIWFTGADEGSARALHAVTLAGALRTLARVPANLQLGDISADGGVLLWQENARRGIAGRAPGESVDRDLSWLDWSQPMALSEDGTSLLITEQGDGGGSDYGAYLRPTDGGPAVRLGTGQALDLSADGTWVLMQRISPAPAQLFLLPTGAGDARPVTNDALAHANARFMPGDRAVIFTGFEADRPVRTFVQDLSGGQPRAVTPEGVASINVSPDGLMVIARAPDGTTRFYPVAGGDARPVPGLEPADGFIRWTADGRGLYLRRLVPETNAVQIATLDLATGRRTPVRQVAPISSALPLGGVGQLLITPDASGYVYGYGVTLADLYIVGGLPR
jgi:hypothetical protein